mgnify:CR=1 FL=1
MVALLALLGACSNKPKEVEPTALQGFERDYRVSREWHRYSGFGSLRTPLRLEPALSEQFVYIADLTGRLRALQRDNGRTVWRHSTELRISTGVRGGYGRLLVGTRDGEAVALSDKDGSELWRTQLSGELLSRPATDGEVAIFQSQDGRVVALNAADGAVLWSFEVTVPVLSLRGLQVHADESPTSPVLFALEDVTARIDIWASLWQQRFSHTSLLTPWV